MTRRPALALSPSLAARNPHLRPSGRPATGTPLPGPQDAATVHHRRSTPHAGAVVVVDVPGLRLVSEANSRGHTKHAKGGRNARVRAAVARAFLGVALPPLPLRVCVTRIAPCALDSDNIHGSGAKAVRDEVADVLGLRSDRDHRVEWRVTQMRGPVGVRVTLVPLPARRSTVDVGETADVVRLRVPRGDVQTFVMALLREGCGTLRAGGVVVETTVEADE